MSRYKILVRIAYSSKKNTAQKFANVHQSSSLLCECGINFSNKAASTFVEQCGHVRLFSNH